MSAPIEDEWSSVFALKDATIVPAPGTAGAVQRGCTCPILDNDHGKGCGKDKQGSALYWITAGCPLHDATKRRAKINDD